MNPASQFVTVDRNPVTHEVKMMNLSALGHGADAALTTIDLAYRSVPWFRRACKLRANAIGRFPLTLENDRGDDVSEEPEYQQVVLWTRRLLYRVEMNVVKYGASYHLLEKNRFGLNATPRFLPTGSVIPRSNFRDGLTGFMISGIGDFELKDNRVIWVWEPNDLSEVLPGPADGEAALKASGLLYAIDEMANRYMGSGGVPVTAVRVPATVSKDERTKVENFLTRFAGGFRNAFKFLVIDKGTEFETIGSELRQMQTDKLTADQRDNVAVAIGVPPTVIDGKAANFATAESEMTGFYMNTVIPQAEQYEPVLNTQLYALLGLTLRFNPDELDVMQAIQLDQAQGVKELAGDKQIISVNEARGIIEYDPIGERGDWPKEAPTTTPPTQFTQPASTASPASLPEPNIPQMRSWLSASLDQLRAGQSPAIGTPFDDELNAANTGNSVRRIYESHWPRKSAPPSWQEQAVIELRRLNDAREADNGRIVHE